MIIREGRAKIEVSEGKPEQTRRTGFFNPAMRENRDIAVLSLKWFGREHGKGLALDAFSATGIRAIRFEKEAGWRVVATEVNETAFERLKRNLEMNHSAIEAKLVDCRLEMMTSRFQAIDIDPYGSPSQFIECAGLGLDKKSLLMVTATDTANLFGVYPRKCEKLYGILPNRSFSQKEFGTRLLLSYVMKELFKYDKAFEPLLSYAHRHYVRLIGLVSRSSRKVSELMDGFGEAGKSRIYMGSIKDNSFISSIIDMADDNISASSISLLNSIRNELDVPFYYDSHKMKLQLSLDEIKRRIESAGYRFSRTHFSPTSFKTDMPEHELKGLL